MKVKEVMLWQWQPGVSARTGILAGSAALALGIGYLHTLTGLAYEFHVLFILPVLLVAWFLGARAGYGLALLAAVVWFIADRILAAEQADPFPLLFNSGMRLAIFLGGAWLLGEMRRVLQRVTQLASEDSLTQLPNRREFHERGRRAFSQARRQAVPVTAVFIDIDKFKEINDELGHDAGDQLLVTVAQVIRSHVRESDVPGRLGGDEFALLLPDMNASSAMSYAEKLRQRLLAAMREQCWPVTFSIGVASYDFAPHDFDSALAQADALMYEAKNGGRNRVQQRTFSGAES
ncbi:MAG: diguanylate cyclase [Burkholderiales bacterium]|nr:diguanylate cyclase [Burkholderiales bacterium]